MSTRKEYTHKFKFANELAHRGEVVDADLDMETAMHVAHCMLQWDDAKGVWFYIETNDYFPPPF